MKFSIDHEFDVGPETFWSKLFFDQEFNRELYLNALGFREYAVLEEVDRGEQVVRRVRAMPKPDAPAAIQKLIGDKFAYVEEGTFDKARKRYHFRMVPSTMADKIKTEGDFWVETIGPRKVRRVVETDLDVKVFGIGGVIESFVVKSTRDTYEQAAAFIRKWIVEKGL